MMASQNVARKMWNRYTVSLRVKVCFLKRCMVSLGESDLSIRPTAAIKAAHTRFRARDTAAPGFMSTLRNEDGDLR